MRSGITRSRSERESATVNTFGRGSRPCDSHIDGGQGGWQPEVKKIVHVVWNIQIFNRIPAFRTGQQPCDEFIERNPEFLQTRFALGGRASGHVFGKGGPRDVLLAAHLLASNVERAKGSNQRGELASGPLALLESQHGVDIALHGQPTFRRPGCGSLCATRSPSSKMGPSGSSKRRAHSNEELIQTKSSVRI